MTQSAHDGVAKNGCGQAEACPPSSKFRRGELNYLSDPEAVVCTTASSVSGSRLGSPQWNLKSRSNHDRSTR
jgi:hypothetical protein